jgi:hypothetical protein
LDSNALLAFLKHVINVIMWIMYKGCYILPPLDCTPLPPPLDWDPSLPPPELHHRHVRRAPLVVAFVECEAVERRCGAELAKCGCNLHKLGE